MLSRASLTIASDTFNSGNEPPANCRSLLSLARRLPRTFAEVCTLNELFCAWIADRIPAYLDGREADVLALQRALADNDLACIQDLAHKMKGTGSSYGFSEITEIGGRMETAAKVGNRGEVEASVSALRDYLATARARLKIAPGEPKRNSC